MFTKEEMEYIKNASKHVEVLCGGRGYNKTHEVIGQSLQENEKLKQALLDIKNRLNNRAIYDSYTGEIDYHPIFEEEIQELLEITNKALGDKNGE